MGSAGGGKAAIVAVAAAVLSVVLGGGFAQASEAHAGADPAVPVTSAEGVATDTGPADDGWG
ncbi:hypothetical protein SLNWT_0240 [Streptomyces albus]|uniref:Uncharacterized protein n=1 Tax=Streptomyces albus (strain ATCC 21838 / DSM 41398 / FERM P-419 / JCM 4703 / NBRC 107858) TaxID=1081613 RepID=A0A0B5EP82_STRA4|nr:hypothetical protein SLNWT_0240 [Streptomyces albus]AOU74929.1 hypothetical protein SLNHY_0238 [Streptomyces albus]AYN30739.1 hypothetical protein DUI70_0236 [Streptomyces albus]